MGEPVPEELLTVAELCAWFKVTKNWVYDEVEAGRLPHVRIGRRHLRFRRSDLRRYLADSTAQALTRPPRPRNLPTDLEPLD